MDKGLAELADVLGAISETPLDYSLHVKNVALAKSLEGMDAELVSALEMFTQFYAAGEDVWTELIEKKAAHVDLDSESGWKELLNLYEQAEGDYLCACFALHASRALTQTYSHQHHEDACAVASGHIQQVCGRRRNEACPTW